MTPAGRWLAAILSVAVLAGVVVALGAKTKRDWNTCSMTPPGFPRRFTSMTMEWQWFPPGNVCVWRAPDGEEMRRRSDEVYPWRDRGEGGPKVVGTASRHLAASS